MRKIDLTPYFVTGPDPSVGPQEYRLHESIVELLFHPTLRLGSTEALKQNVLAEKILVGKGSILLEDEEYQRLRKAVDTFQGFTRNDVGLLERVINAPEVPVKEDSEPNP